MVATGMLVPICKSMSYDPSVMKQDVMKHENETSAISRHLSLWWKRQHAEIGLVRTIQALGRVLWEFASDSLPEPRRQRYGDAEYDWDYRVNTTSGTVGWRDRFLGQLHSPYMPTEPGVFHEMMGQLTRLESNLEEFIFVDLGSGKGRTLLMASDYPFRGITGVELLPSLQRAAQENIAAYKSQKQKCLAIESVCADACTFQFPAAPLVLYLFNPLPEHGLVQALKNLEVSLEENPRKCFVLYHNPLLKQHFTRQPWLEKNYDTQQFAIYRFCNRATVPAKAVKME